MDYLVGVDLGSTSLKAVVYDKSGKAIAAGSRPTERFHPCPEHPEWTVWQPEQIWSGTAEAIRDAISQLDDASKIRGLAVTGMGMDGLPIDADGKWLYPFISWLDPRTAAQHKWWLEHIGADRTFSIGGNPVWAINSALRIRWMMEHESDILAKADKWLLIEDFLNFMLCGRRATDYSMASCMMLFDQRTRDWSADLLDAAGIDRRLMPEALPATTHLGGVSARAAAETNLPEGTPVILGGHDHLCGSLPVGAYQPGVVLDVTGTWEIVSAAAAAPVLEPALGQAGLTVQAHVARDTWAAWASTPAGECLEWFRKLFGAEDVRRAEAEGGSAWDYIVAAAETAAPGAGGAMFLPHLSGSTGPVVDPASRGAFVGLRSMTTRGEMIRAIFEGLGYQFLDILGSLERGAGIRAEKVVAVGGATRNTFWMQNKADVSGRVVEAPDIEEATPLGAAMLAGIGTGLYDDADDACRHVYRPGATFQPNPEQTECYAKGFERYRQMYPALKPINDQLATEE